MKKTARQFRIAIETSGRTGSAAVQDGNGPILETVFSGLMRHSAELFTTLDVLLKKTGAVPSEIIEVCITAGPGSFTGLRIAVTAAKMFSLAQQTNIIAADTMDVIAENALCNNYTNDCIATILDAKKGVFYAAVFDRTENGWVKCLPTAMVTAKELLDWLETHHKQNVGLLGEGLLFYAGQFEAPFTQLLDKSLWAAKASALLGVGQRMAAAGLYADPLTLTPCYIGRPDAVELRLKRDGS